MNPTSHAGVSQLVSPNFIYLSYKYNYNSESSYDNHERCVAQNVLFKSVQFMYVSFLLLQSVVFRICCKVVEYREEIPSHTFTCV